MKKIFLPVFFCLLASQFIAAQNKEKVTNESPKFFAVFSAGAAVPVGAFAKKNPEITTEAGLAKLGYNLTINAGYQFTERIGIASSLYHSRFKLDQKAIDDYLKIVGSDIKTTPDHWQYYGLVVGPMVSFSLSKDVYLDFKAMGGVANANMPVFKFEAEDIPIANANTKEHWAYSFAWQLGSNIRYNFARGVCFYANYDYNYMKPTWSVENFGDFKQKMGVMDFNVGIGATF